jgi:hypothetical protein
MDKESLGILGLMKALKLGISYASIVIASNYTSQIYTEKVYVRNENPPKLINMLFLFLGIELAMTVVAMSLIGLLFHYLMTDSSKTTASIAKPVIAPPTIEGGASNFNMMEVMMLFAQDYVLYIIVMMIQGTIIANVMYSKKYFLYKEDGLRGIRAYTDMLVQTSLFNGSIPFNLFVTGALDMASKLNV